MSGPLLRLADLKRSPELHLDELLDVLRQAPDGCTTARTQVRVGSRTEAGWAGDADGYQITIAPEHICGFSEEGDGKVLTLITGRVKDSRGGLTLTSLLKEHPRTRETDGVYYSIVWQAHVRLGEDLGNWEPNPRAGYQGLGECETPGVAALIAYLRAWGVLE